MLEKFTYSCTSKHPCKWRNNQYKNHIKARGKCKKRARVKRFVYTILISFCSNQWVARSIESNGILYAYYTQNMHTRTHTHKSDAKNKFLTMNTSSLSFITPVTQTHRMNFQANAQPATEKCLFSPLDFHSKYLRRVLDFSHFVCSIHRLTIQRQRKKNNNNKQTHHTRSQLSLSMEIPPQL